MELLQLKYFKLLAEKEHLTNTASELIVSASSLSHTIRHLEEELGVSLFDRVGRRIVLNEYGKVYYESVSRALAELENGKQQLQKMKDKNSLTILIYNLSLWSESLYAFQNAYPEISMDVRMNLVSKTDVLLQNVDFYLGNEDDLPTRYCDCMQVLPDETLMLAVSRKHPLAHCASVDLRTLENEKFFSLMSSTRYYGEFENYILQKAGLHPSRISGDRLDRMDQLLKNRCVCLTSSIGMRTAFHNNPDICFIPVSYPDIKRRQIIAWDRNLPLNDIRKCFREFIQGFFKEHGSDETIHTIP